MAGGRGRQPRQDGDAQPRFDRAKRTGDVSDIVGPVELQAVSSQRIVNQRAIAAVATDGDDTVRHNLRPAHLFARC